MKKLLTILACGLGIMLANESSAQTRYGTSKKEKIDGQENSFRWICIQGSTSVCQQWGTNSDGSRFVIVFVKGLDGENIGIAYGVMVEAYDESNPGTYVADPATGQLYYSVEP